MSDRVDRILELLDNELQHAGDDAYPTDFGVDPSTCWRCQRAPGEGPAGVCPDCRATLLDETYRRPDIGEWMAARFWRTDGDGGWNPPDGEHGRRAVAMQRLAEGLDLPPELIGPDAIAFTMGPVTQVGERQQATVTFHVDDEWVERMIVAFRQAFDAMLAHFQQVAENILAATGAIQAFARAYLAEQKPTPPVPAKAAHRRRYGR